MPECKCHTDSHARDLGATVSLLLAPGTPGSRSAGPGGEWPQAADADNTREARSSPGSPIKPRGSPITNSAPLLGKKEGFLGKRF